VRLKFAFSKAQRPLSESLARLPTALEPAVLALVREHDTAFVDLAAISVSDIAAEVEELAVNFDLGVGANRATGLAIRDALARTSKH
jgi:hypothetical protein